MLAFVALKRKASGFALKDKALLYSTLAYMFSCEHSASGQALQK
jgi:hypothetical protein